ncbi:MAG: hypothetical protein U1F66_03875 [bacterium]
MKKIIITPLLALSALATCLWGVSARAETIFIPAVWITSGDAETMADQFCITPEGTDTSDPSCQQEIDTCRTAVKMTMLAKMLNLKSAGECMPASGNADADPTIYPFGCKHSDALAGVQKVVEAADASNDFDAEIQNSCKTVQNNDGAGAADTTGGTNDQGSNPVDVNAGENGGGCSLSVPAPLAEWPSLIMAGFALLLFGLIRKIHRKGL